MKQIRKMNENIKKKSMGNSGREFGFEKGNKTNRKAGNKYINSSKNSVEHIPIN